MTPLWLHLGCGDFSLPKPWVNVDYRMQPGVDRVDNIGLLRRFSPESAERIYCSHALDHFTRWTYQAVLKRWFDLLQPGGELWLSVIDFAVIAELYLTKKVPMRSLTGSLAAAQDYENNVRHVHFDRTMLSEDLILAGFRTVSRHDGPFFADDCSASQVAGVNTSLNLIATK